MNTSLTQSVITVCEMFGKFMKFTAEIFCECQNVNRVKRPAKNTDVCMFYTFIWPKVYVAFILDMIIVFNKIINNSRPPTWYFSLTKTGNKEFIIVGLTENLKPIIKYNRSFYSILTYTRLYIVLCS